MPKFAANLTSLYRNLQLPERIFAAAESGFEGVEIQYPYDTPAMEIRNALSIAALPLVLINAPPPNYTGGTAGFAAQTGSEERFRHDFRRAMRYAQALKTEHVHVMSGAAWGDRAFGTMVENLRWACAFAPEQSLTIEPMNAQDLPGYFMSDFELAKQVIEAVNAPNLGLQFDTYHAYRTTGDVLESWQSYGHLASHVQIAGIPDQHEPDDGDLDLTAFLKAVEQSGYDGWVSADYRPRAGTEEGLGWLEQARSTSEAFRKPA